LRRDERKGGHDARDDGKYFPHRQA
jgi:hypothetical protein